MNMDVEAREARLVNRFRYNLGIYAAKLPVDDLLKQLAFGIPDCPRLDAWLRSTAKAELDRRQNVIEGGDPEEPDMLSIDFRDWLHDDIGRGLFITDVFCNQLEAVEQGSLFDLLHTAFVVEAARRLRSAEAV